MNQNFHLEIPAVQAFLKEAEIDGWLIYDFHGLNKAAAEIFTFSDHFFSRRWFYFIPKSGEPIAIVHKIEDAIFPVVPGKRMLYAGWQELQSALETLLAGVGKVAMEYSPKNAIPTNSYVDAGTIETIRAIGPEVVSSANLVQFFTCRLSDDQLQSHIKAVRMLHETQEKAFQFIETRLQKNKAVTEFDVQQFIRERIYANGFQSMSDAIVGVNGNASNPHYAPTKDLFKPINKGDCILIDLWAKEAKPNSIYGDITWVGFAGKNPPEEYVKIFEIDRDARDKGVALLQDNHAKGKTTLGHQVDDVVREHIASHNYGDYFFHRTGHSIGQEDHGKGANIDGYETVDLRELVPGLLFSIEPGIYLPQFGVRTEIDVYYGANGPEVFAPMQKELVLLDV
ncbi:MAG: aminopeptidase P family protein [Deferribacteres bacterium]|nr:aminopeptidase P family protein [Deferribacteres bacterium]